MNTVLLSLKNNISSLLVAFLMLCSVGSWGQTVVTHAFAATSGVIDPNLNYTSNQNSASSQPAFTSSQLRLYYHISGDGCSITLYPSNGAIITDVKLTSTLDPDVKYNVDGGSDLSATIATGSPNVYSISSINASTSLKIRNANTVNIQLRLTTIEVTYTLPPTCTPPTDPTGTISATTPACTSTVLSYSGTAPSSVVNYWQTSATGTSTSNDAASTLNVNTGGNYFVRAFDTVANCWSTNSVGPYNIVINTPISISTQPVNRSIASGANTTFVVAGSNIASYQWQVDTGSGFGNLTNGAPYSTVTTGTLTLTNATYAMTGYLYRCVLTANAPCGASNSNSATLTVAAPLPAPVVTPQSPSGTVGVAFSTTISASNSATSYAISSGTLPAGLSLNTTTGLISGTPTTAGSLTVAVIASNGITSAPVNFNFTIAKGTQILTVSPITIALPGTTALASYITNSSGLSSYTYVVANPSIATETAGTLTAVAVGSTTIAVTATGNANYNAGSGTLNVTVTNISYPINSFLSTTGTGVYTNTTSVWSKCGNVGGCTGTTIGSGGWGAIGASGQAPTAGSTAFIQGNITGGTTGITNMTILSGGTLTTSSGNYPISNSMTVKTGGKLIIGSNLNFSNTSTIFTVEDNAEVVINSYTTNPNTSLWNGIEVFAENSTVTYNYGRPGTSNEIFNPATVITTNPLTGAKFGNLVFQPTTLIGTSNWTGIFPTGTYMLTKNDLTVSNSTDRNFTFNGGDFTIGRDMIINVTSTGAVATRASGGNQIISVNRDFIKNGSGLFRTNGSGTSILNINRNLNINEGTFSNNGTTAESVTSTVNLKENLFVSLLATLTSNNTSNAFVGNNVINLAGSGNIQTINVVNQATTSYATINVKSGAYAQLINQNFALGTSSKLTVEDGATFDFGFAGTTPLNVMISGSQIGTIFETQPGSILKITSTAGITSSGATGNVQTATRTFGNSNYHYIGKANQVTGTGLPATINTLTINNSGAPGKTVTLTNPVSISSATNSLRLQAGLLDLNTKQLDIPNGGIVESTGGDFKGTAGPLNFVGSGSSTGVLNFPTVTINGGVNFNTGANIVTSLQLNANSFVNPNAPTYGSSSTLIYNTGGPYGRNVEFGALSGAGYPNHVLIQNGTTLDLSANSPADLAIAGNLTLGNLTATGSLSMGSMGNKFTVGGNVSIGANTSGGTSTLSLSSVNAGDIHVKGNWTKSSNGDFIPNNRAVFFAGASPQTLTGATTFDYLRMLQTANSTLTLINNINIAKDIVFGTGKIVTGLNTVVMNTTATASSGENINSYIHGKQQWDFNSPSVRFYSIGDATVYAGVNIAYTSVTNGGALNISTAAGDQANIGTSVFDANQTVNRNYTLTTPNTLAGTYSATFGFDAGDKDAGIDTAKLSVGNYVGGAWNYPAVGARTATSTQGTGITTFGDFQLASKGDCSSIKTWNGSVWIGGTPTMDDAVIFNGDYDTTTLPNVESCECMINAGKTVTVTLDKTLKVNAGLTVSDNGTPLNFDDDGKLLIKDGGSLVQVKDVVNATANNNVGSINMERITKPVFRYDFTYWSSPVQNFKLKSVSPTTLFNKFFHWNEIAAPQAWELHNVSNSPDYEMEIGRGYIVRAPQTYAIETLTSTPTDAQKYTANFIGKPNNGIVTMSVAGSTTVNKWNLLGNPYPSAIDAQTFLTANSNLGGTLYFWTHNTSVSSSSPNYAPSDYAAWNTSGGIATYKALSSETGGSGDNFINPSVPNGKIAAGQSFFVKGIADGVGSVTFNNATRISGQNNQFFKTTPTVSDDNTTGKHRVWLNLKGQVKGFNQILVGYIENATNAYDNRFDGESFGGNFVTFYSVLDTKNLVIQGRALPFSDEDTVPLGYKTTLTGNLIISIDHLDGLMEDQDIYLQDNSLNVVHNLKDSDYTFASIPGTFNSRFVLRYVPQVDLSNPTFDEQVKGVRIYKNQANLYVNSPYETIATVAVYDITGRKLYEQKDCNTNRFETNHISTTDQALIVKVTLKNGAVVTEKVL